MAAIKDALNDATGAKIVSIILGFGLAAVFRKVCHGNGCRVIQGPPKDATNDMYYKVDEDCYKYSPYAVSCPKEDDV